MSKTVASALSEVLAERTSGPSNPPNILQTLHAVQNALGYVPAEAVCKIAHALAVSTADVAGVLSYYPDLHTRPTGRHLIRVCMGESCVANHSAQVMQAFQAMLRANPGETTLDAHFTLEKVYCVGNCAVAPSVMVDDNVHGRVAPPDVPELLERYE